MLGAALLFALLAVLAAATAVASGQWTFLVNALIPGLVSALFVAVAFRQEIHLDQQGVGIKGFGATTRRVRWKEVERLELTDASPWRLGPRIVLRGGRSVPMPAGWRLDGGGRLPEAVLAWSRWARVDVVGERLTPRRWPIVVLVAVGAVVGVGASVAGI